MEEREGEDGMTPPQLAEKLGLNRATIYRWIRADKIRVGSYPSGRWRVPQSEVDRILRELKVGQ